MNRSRWAARILGIVAIAAVPGVAPADVVVVSSEDAAEPTRPHGVRIDGVCVEAGAVNLTKGDNGLLLGGDVTLGTLFVPWIDFAAGARWWSADIDRREFGDTASGSVTNLSVHTDLRVPFFTVKGLRPYVLAGPAVQFVSADVPGDPSLEDALAGFRMGFDTGFGISTTGRKVRWRLEGRREFVEDVGNWNLALGLGVWPDTRASRPKALAVRAPAPQTVTPVQVWTTPAQQAPPAAAPPSEPLEPLVRELIEDNLTMRAELEAMRRDLARKPEPEPAPAKPAAPTPAPPPAPAAPAAPEPSLRVSLERAAALSPGSRVERTSDGWRYVLGGHLTFESNSSSVAPEAREDLRRLAAALLRFPHVSIVVEGHTDSVGPATKNLELSEERAAAVRAQLVVLGIDPERIVSRGFGSTKPITDNATPQARARNRRVEVRVVESTPSSSGREP